MPDDGPLGDDRRPRRHGPAARPTSTSSATRSRPPSASPASPSPCSAATARPASRSPRSCGPASSGPRRRSRTVGVPQEIGKILQGTLLLSAVIAFEVVRRYRDAPMVRDAAARTRRRATTDARRERSGVMTASTRRPPPTSATAGLAARIGQGPAAPRHRRPCSASAPCRPLDRAHHRPTHPTSPRGPRFIAAIGGGASPILFAGLGGLVLGAGRHRQHRPRGHDDPRHVVRRLGRLALGAVGGDRLPAPSAARSAGCSWRWPRSRSASTTIVAGIAINLIAPGVTPVPVERDLRRPRRRHHHPIADDDGTASAASVPIARGRPGDARPTRGSTSGEWFFVSDVAGLLPGVHDEPGLHDDPRPG